MDFNNGEYFNPKGRSRGLSIWWLDECKFHIIYKSANIIDAMIEEDGLEWHLTSVYSHPRRDRRIEVWNGIPRLA